MNIIYNLSETIKIRLRHNLEYNVTIKNILKSHIKFKSSGCLGIPF